MKTMKRVATCVLAALMLLAAVPALPAAQAADAEVYVATGDVYMRKGPGTKYDAIVTVRKGCEVTVTDTSNGTWYKATFKGKKTYKGYVSKKYLKKKKKEEKKEEEKKPGKTYVATGDVNMRKGAGMKYAIVVTVPKGGEVTVTETGSVWYKATYKVKKKTYEGYISGKFLKEKGAAKKEGKAYKATVDVNLRKKASKKAKVLVVVPKNGKVTVKKEKVNKIWSKVQYKTKKKTYNGYIISQYLKKA